MYNKEHVYLPPINCKPIPDLYDDYGSPQYGEIPKPLPIPLKYIFYI